jgi:glycosyltransferase involved in cell wall biosynthesis
VRVLQVIQEVEGGGAERLVRTLSAGLVAAGHEVAVAAHGAGRSGGHELPLLGRGPHRVPAAALALRGALRRSRADIVHAHNPGMAAVVGLATMRGRRPCALVTSHGVPPSDDAATARVLRLAGLPVVACGPGVAAALADHGVRVRATICNAVGPAPVASERSTLMASLGLGASLRLVVAVGRLVHQKHHGLAIDALRDVPGAALVIVGAGPEHDALSARVAALGLGDRVRLVGARADARAVLGAADALVLSSRWEGLPLVALEAAVAGVPIVATDVRGVRELFRDGEAARLVPADDAVALAGALREVLGDGALSARLVAGARRVAEANGEEQMVASYVAIYEELACRRG